MASPQTRNLKTANGGKVAPQHYNDAMGDFEYSKGSDGALHTKVINQPSVTLVDKNGNPLDSGNKLPVDVAFPSEQAVKDTDVLAKLADIETKIQATNDRLNQTLNTQLTGSYIEQVQIATALNVGAGVSIYVPDSNGITTNCSSYSLAVFSKDATNNHSVTIKAWPVVGQTGLATGSDFGQTIVVDNKMLNNFRGVSGLFQPRTLKTAFYFTNNDTSAHTYDIYLYRFYDSK